MSDNAPVLRTVATRSVGDKYHYINTICNRKGIVQGSLNIFKTRPRAVSEHQESSAAAQGTVTSSNIIGQIFKASEDNINGLGQIVIETDPADNSLDSMESYANSAALQAVWVASDDLALLEETIVSPNFSSTKSMEMPLDTVSGEWIQTVGATNLTGGSLTLDYYQDNISLAEVSFFIGDGTETKSIKLLPGSAGAWEAFAFSVDDMTEDSGTPVTITAITKVGIRIDVAHVSRTGYLDNLRFSTAATGAAELKLWDMGAELPISGVTSIDDGTQYTTLGDLNITGVQVAFVDFDLFSGKRRYVVDAFIAGSAQEMTNNVELTVGNYYAITFNYVATDYIVYGQDSTEAKNRYANGYAFTAASEAAAIATIGADNDVSFIVYSCVNSAYVEGVSYSLGAAPGSQSQAWIGVEGIEMDIKAELLNNNPFVEDYNNLNMDLPIHVPKGGKVEFYYTDDSVDSVTVGIFRCHFAHKEPDLNG